MIVEFLADWVVDNYESIKFDFSDEDLMAIQQIDEKPQKENSWKLYFDSTSNALGHGIGAILISPKGEYCPFTTRLDFNCTNNVAKY